MTVRQTEGPAAGLGPREPQKSDRHVHGVPGLQEMAA